MITYILIYAIGYIAFSTLWIYHFSKYVDVTFGDIIITLLMSLFSWISVIAFVIYIILEKFNYIIIKKRK